MRLPDEYYDLILDRDQLLEEEKQMLGQDNINLYERLLITYELYKINEKINKIEKELRG